MGAKEYLESYAALKMEVRMNEDRIAEVFYEAQIPATHLSDGSRRTPGGRGHQEKANIRYIETKDRLQPMIDANKAKMREIEATIDGIRNPILRELLRIRYTDTDTWKPLKWRDVAMRMYGDDDENALQRLTRFHREALAAFEAVLTEAGIQK